MHFSQVKNKTIRSRILPCIFLMCFYYHAYTHSDFKKIKLPDRGDTLNKKCKCYSYQKLANREYKKQMKTVHKKEMQDIKLGRHKKENLRAKKRTIQFSIGNLKNTKKRTVVSKRRSNKLKELFKSKIAACYYW